MAGSVDAGPAATRGAAHRCQVRLRNASPELLRLVDFLGLSDALPDEAGATAGSAAFRRSDIAAAGPDATTPATLTRTRPRRRRPYRG